MTCTTALPDAAGAARTRRAAWRPALLGWLLALLALGASLWPGAAQADNLWQVDATFADLSISNGANPASVLQALPDGQGGWYLAGRFSEVAGQPRSMVARIDAQGQLVAAFKPPAINNQVNAIALDPADPDWLWIGGFFTSVDGQDRLRVARLNATTGALDTGFADPQVNNNVWALQPQAGGVVIGGQFITVGGSTRIGIARLKTDGTLDSAFNPNANEATAVIVADGNHLLLGGWLTQVGSHATGRVARINAANGAVDTSFTAGVDGAVDALALQPGGADRVVVAGRFTQVDGQARRGAARLQANGALDDSLDFGLDGNARSVTWAADGALVLGRYEPGFSQAGGQARAGLARWLPDGSLDPDFDPGVDGWVADLHALAGDRLLVAGGFTQIAGTARTSLAMLRRVGAPGTPGAPTLDSATPGDGQATLAFSGPASSGDSPITGYRASCTPQGGGPAVQASGASPLTLSGMVNRKLYECTVHARNDAGAGPESNILGVTPASVPDAPTLDSATPGNGQATLAFRAPANDGGSPITGYQASCTPQGGGPVVQGSGAASPLTLGGLINGSTYDCTVHARNAIGTGPESNRLSVTPATVPGALRLSSATPGDGQITLSFSAPASDGGSPITNYQASCTPQGGGDSVQGSGASPLTLSGLANGSTYDCTVRATNAVGAGPESNILDVTPATVPDAPRLDSATPGDGQATLSFSAPANDGGSPITGYQASCTPQGGGQPARINGSASPLTLTGLINDSPYDCSVRALNTMGEGPDSSVRSVTPSARVVTPVPTLGEWALMLLGLLAASLGVRGLRRQGG